MAARFQFQPFPIHFFLLFFFFFSSLSSSQFTSPQNIQVFFPFPLPPPPAVAPPQPPPPPLPPATTTTTTTTAAAATPSKSSNKTVAKAVAATAASTLVLSGLFFFLIIMYKRHRRSKETSNLRDKNDKNNMGLSQNDQFKRFEGIKGVIVDEQGLDVLYWRNLEADENKKSSFKKEVLRVDEKEDGMKMLKIANGGRKSKKFDSQTQEIPLLRGKSSGSHVWPLMAVEKQEILTMKSQLSSRSPPPTPPSPPPVPPPPPPPLPPKTGGLTLSSRPPPVTQAKDKGVASGSKKLESSSYKNQIVKLKPLHWDKVNANVEHSMVWHKLDNGSFRFNGDLMEALFGTVAINKKSPRNGSSPSTKNEQKSGPPSQIFILDTRKSQNTAIVLRSLAVSRQEIIDCLIQGQGLDAETLEKLTRITPSKAEESLILEFHGNATRLADAESFLYHILRAVPSAFTRFNIMFFKSNYTLEVTHIKKSLKTLETACKELKTRGIFVKLLEAILKAGNRMNSGTSRGNAQAFNLNSLLKLSDVKSSDGKTSLLHFVVEEVVRLEGKRCMINRNHNISVVDASRDRDYIMLGLPIVGGISSEFSNVKKASGIDYNALTKLSSGLSLRLEEITKTVEECDGISGGGRGFVREMERFLEGAKREIQVLREDEERVMEIVKKTNEFYHVGASKDKGAKQFQLFVIVKAFLEMVDKACVDIAIKLQKRRSGEVAAAAVVKSPDRPSVKFPVLPANFMSNGSSDSDEGS